ncbi:uncharacterized protein LOC121389947 isoform X2 [Gigantopelta aegis]|nr:uncharacterized protein LOC121389947 isoform X2 [Gigantopelta aegis]
MHTHTVCERSGLEVIRREGLQRQLYSLEKPRDLDGLPEKVAHRLPTIEEETPDDIRLWWIEEPIRIEDTIKREETMNQAIHPNPSSIGLADEVPTTSKSSRHVTFSLSATPLGTTTPISSCWQQRQAIDVLLILCCVC